MHCRPFAVLLIAAVLASPSLAAGNGRLSYPVVGTNQTAFFDNDGHSTEAAVKDRFPGEDAMHPGPKPSYTDNGDGTITDNVTGLMWEKGYRLLDWGDAEAVAGKTTTGGHRDWRVPTTKELYSLMEYSGNQGSGRPDSKTPPADAVPFIDTAVFDFEYPTFSRYIDAQFVTNTVYTATVMNGQRCFFGVNFADGRIKCYPTVNPPGHARQWFARFVRGNPAYGMNRFVDNGDRTVIDKATGLMWTKVDSGDPALAGEAAGAMTWEQALLFAHASKFAGCDDWRVPNAKELQSIVDYERSPDATGSAAIDPIFETTAITNEAGEPDFPEFWTSTSFEPGRDAVGFFFGRALGYFAPPGRPGQRRFMDVHGAGAQRSDPKTGESSYGFGPQGDTRRVKNYVRLVRDVR